MGRGSLVVTALPLVNCGGNWTWVRTPVTPQVDLAFHPSGLDKIRTSPVLGTPRGETEEERLVPMAAARRSFCNTPSCNRNAPPTQNSCIPKFPVYPPPLGKDLVTYPPVRTFTKKLYGPISTCPNDRRAKRICPMSTQKSGTTALAMN